MKPAASEVSREGIQMHLRTQTLLDEYGAPNFSILQGHHDIATFNKAFEAEGWSVEPWPSDYLSHEYWETDNGGNWFSSNKDCLRAVPVTIVDWGGPAEQLPAKGPNPDLH